MPPARSEADTGQLALLFDVEPPEPEEPGEPDASGQPERPEQPEQTEQSEQPEQRGLAVGEAPAPAFSAGADASPAGPAGDWRAILDFERGWSGPLAAKQRAVRDSLGLSSARYHQQLDRALELPEALAYDPALVGRLRRVREARRSKRFARRVDASG